MDINAEYWQLVIFVGAPSGAKGLRQTFNVVASPAHENLRRGVSRAELAPTTDNSASSVAPKGAPTKSLASLTPASNLQSNHLHAPALPTSATNFVAILDSGLQPMHGVQ